MPAKIRDLVAPVAFCLVTVLQAITSAAITYKGEGTAGGFMPDFTQYQGQKNNGICAAAATADALWFIDQHDFPGLVDHKDAAKPNDTWKDDSKKLVLDMAARIFGQKYVDGEGDPEGGFQKGVDDYIKSKNYFSGQKENNHDRGLSTRQYSGDTANYSLWKTFAGQTPNCAIGDFVWRDANNGEVTYKNNVGVTTKAHHAMTAAGVDSNDAVTEITMGWGDHPAADPPYKKPPYAAGVEPFINEYPIRLAGPGTSKTMIIDKKDDIDLFKKVPAPKIVLENILTISAFAEVKVKPAAPQPGKPGARKFGYGIQNLPTNDFAVQQWFLQVQTPYDITSVETPAGWNAMAWDPKQTPDISPDPAAVMPAPGDDFDGHPDNFTPTYAGILFYTNDPLLAVAAGGSLDGFSFEASDIYPYEDDALWAGLSSTRSAFLDPTYTGMVTEFTYTAGPVPEPAMAGVLSVGLLVSLRRRFN